MCAETVTNSERRPATHAAGYIPGSFATPCSPVREHRVDVRDSRTVPPLTRRATARRRAPALPNGFPHGHTRFDQPRHFAERNHVRAVADCVGGVGMRFDEQALRASG